MDDKLNLPTVLVKLENSGVEFSSRQNQSLLDSCIEAGIVVPYNCRSGECGECIVTRKSGEFHEMPGADPSIFNDKHRASDKLLLCMCFPRSDMVLDVPTISTAPAIRPSQFNALVVDIVPQTPTIVKVTLETPWPAEYRAGQYFEWILSGITPNRMYSAANRPGSDRIDFFIRLYPDGKASQYIKNTLMIGQAITINGPFGNFSFSDAQWRPSICVAGGTGMAPLHAVLEEAASRHDPRPIHFFFGARTQDELYCLDTIARWKKELPSFTFIPVLSDEPTDSNWTGERGMVTDVMAHHIPDVFGLEAYLCGPPGMIDAASDYLQQAGLTTADIHADRFVQTK